MLNKVLNQTAEKTVSILVVEDVAIAQTSIISLMEHLNCKVTIAGTGQEAIEITKNQVFDIIFMDIGLPDIDVLTVTEAVQKNYQLQTQTQSQLQSKTGPIIIALTAHGSEYIKTQCFQAGMQDFFVKPLTLSNAQEIFNKYID